MNTKIYESQYKNIRSVTLENELLMAQFTPEYGGKMVSLIQKNTSREFLQQAEDPQYKVLKYDGSYVEAECSGFDDMFPTIDRFVYHAFPWKGVEMPDHGEVCGLGWDWEITGESLSMSVNGVRFPYRLEKCISFTSDNTLNIRYKVSNPTAFDMDFLWAAHTMIETGSGGEIIIPSKGRKDARVVFTSDDRLGSFGDTIAWPVCVDREGTGRLLSTVNSAGERIGSLKFYFRDKVTEGWCGFCFKEDNTKLILSFPAEMVPYLGILVSDKYGLILEPCTATMDRPDVAGFFGQNSVLPAKGEYSWYLNMSVE